MKNFEKFSIFSGSSETQHSTTTSKFPPSKNYIKILSNKFQAQITKYDSVPRNFQLEEMLQVIIQFNKLWAYIKETNNFIRGALVVKNLPPKKKKLFKAYNCL